MNILLTCSLLALAQGFAPARPFSARIAHTTKTAKSTRILRRTTREVEETDGLLSTNEILGVLAIRDGQAVGLGKVTFLRALEDTTEQVYLETETSLGTLQDNGTEKVDLGKEIFSGTLEENAQLISKAAFNLGEKLSTISVTSAPVLPVMPAVSAGSSLPIDLTEQLDFHNSNGGDTSEAVVASTPLLEIPSRDDLSAVVGVPRLEEKVTAPRVSKILKFAVPAIGVWLCGPLLSLIDTSSVGLLSGTIQQAALNPATAVTDYAALLIAFLYTSTTNLIAAARETDRNVEGKPRAAKTFIGAMQLSTYVGAGLGAILFVFARPLLRAIIGNDGISPAVFDAAMKYVRIRALGMPAAAVIGSAQAACLGMQDIRSPLYVLGVAAAVNFMGDMLFVGASHPMLGGAAGAAWATVFSQYAAVAMFMHWLCNKAEPRKPEEPAVVDVSKGILELTGKPKDTGRRHRNLFQDSIRAFRKPQQGTAGEAVIRGSGRLSSPLPKAVKPKDDDDEGSFSVRGFLADRFRGRDLLKIPDMTSVKEVAEYVVPVTSTQVGRVSGYVAMSHVVSSSLGTVSMAAQQVIVSLFYCLCPIADSLSLTAQSFLPAISEKKVSVARARALRQTGINFAKAGAIFGGVMATAVSFIPLLSQFFTADLGVASLVNMVMPLLVVFFAVHGIVCAMEGVLLGQKDLGFLGKMYASYFFFVPFFMLRVKRTALSGFHTVNLTSVWKVFLGYQLFRFSAWVTRAVILQRRSDMQGAEAVGEQP